LPVRGASGRTGFAERAAFPGVVDLGEAVDISAARHCPASPDPVIMASSDGSTVADAATGQEKWP
jgi:Flp pilus assembly CpaE family ATPase